MSESKSSKPEKKKAESVAVPGRPAVNPRWLVPTMLTLMLVGLAWIVTYYLTSQNLGLPIPALGNWNLVVGFVLIIAGFGLTTRWK
ncbi:cell division protein CrgA [Isoptericola dokdonensis]|uniref:Cell division protein CrgA n=1 Tax=Isoptericola dokdonensis DS-3 TaxID=1300344 RepID=A0A168FKM1_9MICO|nr:cell division protein CrgA [Isoptericola dokdonensis]ANC32029.1 Cell division protein CrgA [Isoptericola dokdonensis DS-3]